MKSNYLFIHRIYCIIDYLKYCRNKSVNNNTQPKYLDNSLNINELSNNNINDIIDDIKQNNDINIF